MIHLRAQAFGEGLAARVTSGLRVSSSAIVEFEAEFGKCPLTFPIDYFHLDYRFKEPLLRTESQLSNGLCYQLWTNYSKHFILNLGVSPFEST